MRTKARIGPVPYKRTDDKIDNISDDRRRSKDETASADYKEHYKEFVEVM